MGNIIAAGTIANKPAENAFSIAHNLPWSADMNRFDALLVKANFSWFWVFISPLFLGNSWEKQVLFVTTMGPLFTRAGTPTKNK